MILFFYGEDNYRLKQKLKALKEKFISASLGDTNLAILDGGNIAYDEIVRQIFAMPFLAKTRLVIIENMMKGKKSAQGGVLEKVPAILTKVPSSTVLVFVEEGNPDKRTSLYKKLAKEKLEEFKLLEPEPLRRWIRKEVETRGGNIEMTAISKLAEYIGNDLWRQSNEIDKLLSYNKKIDSENIELLVNPQIQSNIFNLIDQIARKNLPAAAKELYKLLNSGQNELYILTMIIWQYRNLLVVKDLVERTNPPAGGSWALAKKTHLNPFVVQKCLATQKIYTLGQLKAIYEILAGYDFKIKTGKMEARVALELLIFKLCKK